MDNINDKTKVILFSIQLKTKTIALKLSLQDDFPIIYLNILIGFHKVVVTLKCPHEVIKIQINR